MARRSLPLASPVGPAQVATASHQAFAAAFANDKSREQVVSAAEDASAWLSELTEQVAERIPLQQPIACSSGCAYCCHLKVLVTAPEAIRVVAYLRATLDPASFETLRAKVRETDSRTHAMTTDERAVAKIPCPLLDDGKCVAYEARPLACRSANSYDKDSCRRGFEHPELNVNIPSYQPETQIAGAIRSGISNGAGQNGLDGFLLELIAAVRVALDDPSVADTWGRGQPVFASAHDAEFAEHMRRLIEKMRANRP